MPDWPAVIPDPEGEGVLVDFGPSTIADHDHLEPGPRGKGYVAYQHCHVLQESELADGIVHTHDEDRYGPLSPVYGPREEPAP